MSDHMTFIDANVYLRQLGVLYLTYPELVRDEASKLDPHELRTVAAEASLALLRTGELRSVTQIESELSSQQ